MTINLCSTSSVRAVLGVAETELRDEVLLQPIYVTRLKDHLLELHPEMVNDFATAAAANPQSVDQERFTDMLQAYASYRMAHLLVGAVEMFAPKTIQDSKTQVERSTDPYARLKKDIVDSLPYLKTRLLVAYSKINAGSPAPAATERIRVIVSTPANNPVTG